MPAPVRLFIISNKVNGTCKGAAHITPIFYLPHVFVTEPLAAIEQLYYNLCTLASGLAPCSISLYDTMKATRMKQDGTNG